MQLLKNSILTVLFGLFVNTLLSAQTFEWAKIFRNYVPAGIRQTAGGDLITIGHFGGSVDFDPGPATHYLASNGANDFCVLKTTAEGDFLWVKGFGGANYEYVRDFYIDTRGNIYLTGIFSDSADFDPGPGATILTSNGEYDFFVEKLDSAGNMVWVRSFGRQTDEDVTGIRVDTFGNVYTTGKFHQQLDFDPGPGAYFLTPQGLASDVFIQKLDANGNFVWAKQFGGVFNDRVSGFEFDRSGNLLLSGDFAGPAHLRDSMTIDTTLTATGSYDLYLLQLDTSGQLLRIQWFGGPGTEQGGPLAVDSSGEIVMVGVFSKTADFDPGPDSLFVSTTAYEDGVIWRMDPQGNVKWARAYGGTALEGSGGTVENAPFVKELLIDAYGQIFISGTYEGTGDFDPGPSVYTLRSINDSYDFFVEKLAPDGNLIWVYSMGDIYYDGYNSWLDLDASGKLLLAGSFKTNVDLDPGPGVVEFSNGGSFIAKWEQGFDFYGTIFQDTNANQVFDPGEKPLPGVVLDVPGAVQYASTNALGYYHIDANLVGDTLRPVLPRPYWAVTPAFLIPDTNRVQMDFAITIPPDVQDLAISALELSRFNPGEETEFWVGLHNYGTAASDSATVKLVFHEFPGSWIFPLGSMPPVSQIIGDTLWWDIDSIQPDSNYFIKLKFFTAANAVPGTKLAWDAEVILPGDVDTLNNIFRDSTVIFGPYDPNDKQVSPRQATVEALDATRLRYTIRFQNVGNAPAGTVVIRDTLPANLQIASLRLLSASHAFDWKLSGPGMLEIRFPGINLPDSTSNEPGSHGYVLFEILPGQQLVGGDSVLNRAGIYFDLNASVLTPYAVFQVVVDNDGDGFDNLHDCNDQEAGINPGALDMPGNGIDENCDGQDGTVSGAHSPQMVRLQVQPNPAQGRVQVILEQAASGVLEVHAADGKRVLAQTIEQQSFIWLNLDNNPPGVYTLRLLEQGKCVGLGQVVLR